MTGTGHVERLHPEARALLAELAANPRSSSRDLPLPEGRKNFREMFAPLGGSAAVAEVRDVTLETAGRQIGARTYRPGSGDDLPVIVYLHGGGWVFGDLDSHDGLCRMLARESGAVVLSVAYRTAPEHVFPAAADDAQAALCWVHDNATGLGVDAGRVAVAGDSAGGNLAASVAIRSRDTGGPAARCQVLISPALDSDVKTPSAIEFADDPFLSTEEMRWYWERYVPNPDDRRSPLAAPAMAADLSGLPPALVVTAELDVLRDEAEAYAQRMKMAGTPVVLHREPAMMHAFPALAGRLSPGRTVIERIGATLHSILVDELSVESAWQRATHDGRKTSS
ncbi:alpha/beta hydrolase [Mycobacterium sp. NPDC051198]